MRQQLALGLGVAALVLLAGCHLLVSTDDLVVASADGGADGGADGADGGVALDAAGLVGTSAVELDGGVVMSNRVVEVAFDCGQGCVPADIRIRAASNQNLLYRGDAKPEYLAGISYFDHAYNRESSVSARSLTGRGPIAQLEVSWGTVGLTGTSTYTLHPDGRLHRNEEVQVTSTFAGSQDFLLAFVTIDATRVSAMSHVVGGAQTSNLKTGRDFEFHWDDDGLGYLCVLDSAGKDGVGWAQRDTAAAGPDGMRLWEVGSPSHSFLLASDWVRDAPVPVRTYSGQFLTTFASSGDCMELEAQVVAFTDPLQLGISEAVVTGQAGDGDGDGYNEGGGYYELRLPSSKVIAVTPASGSRQPTSSFRVQAVPAASPSPKITLGEEELSEGRDYLAGAPDGSGVAWLHLARPWSAQVLLKIDWR
ncbi:MAG: hypothetical protein HY901_16580 [Deltaproteobacteria bacterium]|nr:hypothetical protein [Deltaproteobacteria bacterium]